MNLKNPIGVDNSNFYDLYKKQSLEEQSTSFIGKLDFLISHQTSYSLNTQLSSELFMPLLHQICTQLNTPIKEHLGKTIPIYDFY